ncbi:MAG: hypothetical protein IJS14_03565 [Lentisphaeria bacterium]|nr:hypothetical protein [Lentisphaeria bacterium]
MGFKKMKSKTALSIICCLLTVLCLFLTACQTSSITVIDAETREPVADAMVFAYCHDYVAFPRQRLYTTDDKGEITFVYQAEDSFWIGKPGYYPSRFYPGYPGPQPHGFLFWFTFPPTTIKLHPVKTGKRNEAKKAMNHGGLIFKYRNPPRESVLLKILQYSHWVYMNTAFYDDYPNREILEDFFEEYSFPLKSDTKTGL